MQHLNQNDKCFKKMPRNLDGRIYIRIYFLIINLLFFQIREVKKKMIFRRINYLKIREGIYEIN